MPRDNAQTIAGWGWYLVLCRLSVFITTTALKIKTLQVARTTIPNWFRDEHMSAKNDFNHDYNRDLLIMNSIGFIGVGALAEYTIKGLRRGGYQGHICLSPRNRETANLLAEKFDCEVQSSNQSVVERSDYLVIATRPEHCLEALAELQFRPDQLLISVVAGIDVDTLRGVIGPGIEIVRAMPVSSAAAGASPTVIYPHSESVTELFNTCGQAITLPHESAFELGTVLACVYTWYFELFEQLIQATAGEKLPKELASKLVLGMAKGAASLALADKSRTPGEIATHIATEGTYSKLGLDLLKDRAAFKPWHDACQLLIDKLKQNNNSD